jgi:hypothetical protein
MLLAGGRGTAAGKRRRADGRAFQCTYYGADIETLPVGYAGQCEARGQTGGASPSPKESRRWVGRAGIFREPFLV